MMLALNDNTKSPTGSDGKLLMFRMKQTTRLGKLKLIFSQRSGIAKEQLLFVSQHDKILQDKDSITSSGLKTNQIFCYMNKDWLEQRVVKPSVFNKVVERTPIQEFSTSENIHGSSDTTNSDGLGSMWKPGFGHGSNNSATADNDREAQKVRKLSATIECLETLCTLLDINFELNDAEWKQLNESITKSPLLPFFKSYLFGNSAMSLLSNVDLFQAILRLVRCFASRPDKSKIKGEIQGLYKSTKLHLIESMEVVSELDEEDEVSCANSADTITSSDAALNLKKAFSDTLICVEKSFAHQKKEAHNTVNGNASRASNLKSLSSLVQDNDDDIYSLYMKTVKVHQFGSMDMKTSEAGKTYAHHYAKQIQDDISGKISKSRNKRVNRELKSLKRDLPLHFGSTIAIRFDQSRPFIMKMLITGPSNTPYDSGCFIFDIYFPPAYPKSSAESQP